MLDIAVFGTVSALPLPEGPYATHALVMTARISNFNSAPT